MLAQSPNHPNNQSLTSSIALKTIRKKIQALAKELANTEEIGLDESTLMKFFESKTE
jgi:hypothetical protein